MLNAEFDKIRLLELIDTEYAFLERTLDLLTPAQMIEPHVEGYWSVKDTLAHLTRWLRRLEGWIPGYVSGQLTSHEIEPGVPWSEMDAMNDRYVQEDLGVPLDRALHEFRMAHVELVTIIEGLDEDVIYRSHSETHEDRTLAHMISANMDEHYKEHVIPIRRWMIRQGIG